MLFETDLLIDRRRLKGRLVFWRSFAIVALVGLVLLALHGAGALSFGSGDYVARAKVDGLIASEGKLTRDIRKVADDRAARALIVSIDSPGGSVTAGEELHDAIAYVATRKPVVSVMGGTAASAAYMIAVPAQRIFARQGTLTGSIGVYLQSFQIAGLLDKLGISSESWKSGPLKDEPSPFEKTSPAGAQMLQGLVTDYYDQFVQMVAAGRHISADAVRKLADGRPYTGRQALSLGLVDQIGGEDAARRWLASAKGVPASLPVRDLGQGSLAERTLRGSLHGLAQQSWSFFWTQWLKLDGIWSIWQRPLG